LARDEALARNGLLLYAGSRAVGDYRFHKAYIGEGRWNFSPKE
jgi:hypothetical protein